ncbi:neurogenic locus notch homolog protein 1-like [Dendronephthya gigantea]|uniref:neurogenic locus notch homolog protein 1-like n=1 Tax=Dendronephthya gigantea TaxID=151771 RepID=UPI00106A4081|nr:neurogenic locus notch homolog protein 1-like [Dendronephthya gigantea]
MFKNLLSTTTIAILAAWIAVTKAADEPTCKNGGIAGNETHPICTCEYGFKGYDCSQRVRPCEGRPCRNGGKCSENNDGRTFKCSCTIHYKGVLCEQRVRPCDSAPCKNGGNCTDDGIKCFKCECPSGFKGPDCSEMVKPCEIRPCKNNGVCVNEGNGRFKCKCKEGFGGTFCDRRDGLYGSKILAGREKDVRQLKKWLGGSLIMKSWRLCYRATENGFAATSFHAKCDAKQPTVTLVRTGRYIFGAYSDQPFGGSAAYKSSSRAFIFSFVNKDNLPPFKSPVYRHNQHAIYTNPGYGPTFGGGHDIHISNLANANTGSYANLGHTYQPPHGYGYGTNKARDLLAGTRNFSPNEIETYF